MYDEPGFWDKVGNKSIDIIGDMIAGLIQKWMDGGGEDDDLLNRINELQDERDRLTNERDNPENGDGMGRIITDPTGNYGYDRDGDGYVDIPLNPDGTPAGPFNPTDDSASAACRLPARQGGRPAQIPCRTGVSTSTAPC